MSERRLAFAGMATKRWVGYAGALVAVFLSLLLTGGLAGRGEEPEPTTIAVQTSEVWLAGQPPGTWTALEVPERIAGLMAAPADVLGEGVVAAADLPAGRLVLAGDVTVSVEGDPTAVVATVPLELSRWQSSTPPVAGERVMLVDGTRDCARHVVVLLGVEGSVGQVAADRAFARELATSRAWSAVPAPAAPEAVDSWMCGSLDGDLVAVPVSVDMSWVSGPPLRAGDTVMLIDAAPDAELCASELLQVWAVRDGTVIEIAASSRLAQRLQRDDSSAGWRVVRPPADRAAVRSWVC